MPIYLSIISIFDTDVIFSDISCLFFYQIGVKEEEKGKGRETKNPLK